MKVHLVNGYIVNKLLLELKYNTQCIPEILGLFQESELLISKKYKSIISFKLPLRFSFRFGNRQKSQAARSELL